MTKRLPFTKAKVRRAVDGARKAGLRVTGVSVAPDGTITVHDAEAPVAPAENPPQDGASSEFEDFRA